VVVCKYFMSDILSRSMVLVLNRNWQAVNVRTPQEAFCMMATNVATGLDIESENHIRPVTWDEWITLAIRPQDHAVQTVRGPISTPRPTHVSAPSTDSGRPAPRPPLSVPVAKTRARRGFPLASVGTCVAALRCGFHP